MEENNTYKTGQILEILGVSRDALRYYEEKGIINPDQKVSNNYREYNFYDIYSLLVTDFYKKRNLTIKEVKKLQEGSEILELKSLLEDKERDLEESIRNKELMLSKIRDTKEFCAVIQKCLNRYSFRTLPIYEIKGEISDFKSVLEYPVLCKNMDLVNDDILSKIMRMYTFDENGFIDSKMYIAEKIKGNKKEKGKSYLDYTNCIYTVVEDGRYQNGSEDVKFKVFDSGLKWAKEQGVKLEGIVFINTRLITYIDKMERVFLEIFIPVKA